MINPIVSKWLFLDFKTGVNDKFTEFVSLSVRVATGLIMLFSHGVGKWMNFSNIAPNFPDPFGFLGSTLSLALVVGSEVFGSILLVLGLFTRWASFSLLFTMLTAAFIVHFPDPFKEKELAILYALIFFFFTVRGGGKYSLDHFLKRKLT
ncbi:MAG: DoxX family protein [Oligoflexia bacterium]|nr:DoxX family protein [Oligoflexia bacterium]